MASFASFAMTVQHAGVFPYQLSVDGFPEDHFRVHALEGRETISETYSFEVVASADAGSEVEYVALGRRAQLTLNVGMGPRAFYGVVAAVWIEGAHEVNGTLKYHLRIVPRLWLLKRKKRSRIFQKMSVPDVVSAVLREAGIPTRWQLLHVYPIREYCTQYEESDYRFVTRLLAEAGIYFYFAEGAPLAPTSTIATSTIANTVASAAASVAGSAAGAALTMAEPLVPGDTVILGDDASFYGPIGGEDAADLAAAGAVALAPLVGAAIGGLSSIRSEALGAASAIAGAVIEGVASASRSAPTLYFLEMLHTATSSADKVTHFGARTKVAANAAQFSDYDPNRPHIRLSSSATSTEPFPPTPPEIAGALTSARRRLVPGAGAALSVAAAVAHAVGGVLGVEEPTRLEVYEHHGDFLFPQWAVANDEAARILRQKRRRASIAHGESGCQDLAPGHCFALSDHPANQLNRTYVVTTVKHRGQTVPEPGVDWRVYVNSFECAPAEVTYVPPRPKRKRVQVSLTATVVGPPGEEIWVDPHGQIKVQFHWDREGSHDEKSSCWIRTMHPWGGAGWGVQFIPRIGMEVMVVFDGGDPDKPIVIGSVYNGTHPPPFALPKDKTRSGFRTHSSPRTHGFNELSFEDAATKEQIYLHAQRDLDEVVLRNHTSTVHVDETLHVMGNRHDTVVKNARCEVRGDREEIVRGSVSTRHLGSRVDVVTHDLDQRIGALRTLRVAGRDDVEVEGKAEHRYLGDHAVRVQGNHTVIVGRHDAKRSMTMRVEGTASISAEDALELAAKGGITLRCGKTTLRIGEDGIELCGSMVRMAGEKGGIDASKDGVTLTSKGAYAHLGEGLVMKTDKASLSMGSQVKVDGEKILLNSPEQATDAPPPPREPPTEVSLVNHEGRPLARQRFIVLLDDGSQRTGVTDQEGKAKVILPKGAKGKIRFPDLTEPKPA